MKKIFTVLFLLLTTVTTFAQEDIAPQPITTGVPFLLIAADAELALTEIATLFNGLASPSFRVPLASLV